MCFSKNSGLSAVSAATAEDAAAKSSHANPKTRAGARSFENRGISKKAHRGRREGNSRNTATLEEFRERETQMSLGSTQTAWRRVTQNVVWALAQIQNRVSVSSSFISVSPGDGTHGWMQGTANAFCGNRKFGYTSSNDSWRRKRQNMNSTRGLWCQTISTLSWRRNPWSWVRWFGLGREAVVTQSTVWTAAVRFGRLSRMIILCAVRHSGGIIIAMLRRIQPRQVCAAMSTRSDWDGSFGPRGKSCWRGCRAFEVWVRGPSGGIRSEMSGSGFRFELKLKPHSWLSDSSRSPQCK